MEVTGLPRYTLSRGDVVYADGKIFLHQADTALVALDAKTGKEAWKAVNGDPKRGETGTNAPIVIKLKNLDAKPMEFESKTLKVEKVVAAGGDATINVRAQKPGRYEFFDEYNEKVARGALVVK